MMDIHIVHMMTVLYLQHIQSQTPYLNIDTEAMATQVNATYYGNVKVGEVLVGSSGAKDVVKDRRLISDRKGTLFGVFFIPSPSLDT